MDLKRRYAVADTFQQVVGGFLLAGPFVVTEEVWRLARNMSILHVVGSVALVFVIGYTALYKTEENRDPETEPEVGGVPLRFVSLIAVSYLSVATLALLFAAPTTFGAGPVVTGKVVSIAAIFSMVGAATADSIF